jgi:mRNA interferase YafQ
MLTPVYSGAFKQDHKLMKKRGKNMNMLNELLRKIIDEQPLPVRCRPHLLYGDWDGYMECHIENDWLLIYKIKPSTSEVLFDRIGTHSDLFKK